MKKIFTLIAASLFTTLLFAADRKPQVTLKSSRGYEVVIDGQSYAADYGTISLYNVGFGQHSIKVYEASRGFRFMRMMRPIAVSSFSVRNNNIDITIGFRGQIMIAESRSDDWRNFDQRDHEGDKRFGDDHQDNHDQGNKGYGNGQQDNHGQGNGGYGNGQQDNHGQGNGGYGNGQQDNHGQGNKGNDKPRRF